MEEFASLLQKLACRGIVVRVSFESIWIDIGKDNKLSAKKVAALLHLLSSSGPTYSLFQNPKFSDYEAINITLPPLVTRNQTFEKPSTDKITSKFQDYCAVSNKESGLIYLVQDISEPNFKTLLESLLLDRILFVIRPLGYQVLIECPLKSARTRRDLLEKATALDLMVVPNYEAAMIEDVRFLLNPKVDYQNFNLMMAYLRNNAIPYQSSTMGSTPAIVVKTEHLAKTQKESPSDLQSNPKEEQHCDEKEGCAKADPIMALHANLRPIHELAVVLKLNPIITVNQHIEVARPKFGKSGIEQFFRFRLFKAYVFATPNLLWANTRDDSTIFITADGNENLPDLLKATLAPNSGQLDFIINDPESVIEFTNYLISKAIDFGQINNRIIVKSWFLAM